MPDGTTSKVRRGRKFDQVLAGARAVFMRAGYEGANVDEIARVAEVSKATLYSYFPDKRVLFLEVVKTECRRQAEQAEAQIDRAAPLPDLLRAAAEQMINIISGEFSQQIFRTCAGEAERFPEVAREFYASGPGLGRERIASFFREMDACGALVVANPDRAADQFMALCKSGIHDRLVFKVDTKPDPAEVSEIIDEAVATFLARYGA